MCEIFWVVLPGLLAIALLSKSWKVSSAEIGNDPQAWLLVLSVKHQAHNPTTELQRDAEVSDLKDCQDANTSQDVSR